MKLHTAVHGDGPRHVALVHGLGVSGALWRGLVGKILADGLHTVTTVDLRGHGSSPSATEYTVDSYAADLVETLPKGLDAVVGHSLGGAVLARAAFALAPRRAVYLDPGFKLGLPAHGVGGKLFWALPSLSVGAMALAGRRARAAVRAGMAPEDRELMDVAQAGMDRKLAVATFRDVTFHPYPPGPPPVPSTIVLSEDAPSVVPAPEEFEAFGWEVRRVPGVHHEFWLEDLDATYEAVRDRL